MSDFTVPTLSLSGSRAKRQNNLSIPTRDQAQMSYSNQYQSGMAYNYESKYNQRELQQPQ